MSDQLELDLDGYGHIPSPTVISPNIKQFINTNRWSSGTGGTSPAIPAQANQSNPTPVGGTISGSYTVPQVSAMFYPIGWFGPHTITTGPAKPVEIKSENKDGCTCKNCKEFYPYAEPNQKDGTLICYGCKLWT